MDAITLATAASGPWAAAASTLALIVLMLGTMTLVPHQRQWIIFLCGVLAASVFACVSHTANARWVIARRTAQLEATRRRLAEETRRRAMAEAALSHVSSHAELIDEAIPAMVSYIDADGVVRYHNRAYTRWSGLKDHEIDGRCLADVLGAGHYATIASHVKRGLEGHEVRFERTQRMPGGEAFRLFAHYVPHFRQGRVAGIFAILTDITAAADLEACRYQDEERATADLAARVVAALERDEFCLYMEPIAALDPASQGLPLRAVSLRLREEEENHLPPGAFLAVAEEARLLPDLDRWVVRKVLETAANPASRPVAHLVSVSKATVHEGRFARFVADELAARKLPGELLCLEFAEADVMAAPRPYRDLIGALGALGCQFAVSGFGRNPMALPFLRQLRVNYLKLDGGIVLNLLREPAEVARLQAINVAAHTAGMRTLAACVEDDGTRALLQRIKTDFALGLGIARPRLLEAC